MTYEQDIYVQSGSETFGTSTGDTKGTSQSESWGYNFLGSMHSWSVGTNQSNTTGKSHSRTTNRHTVIDKKPTFLTIDEQLEITANKFMTMPKLHFYCKVAREQGDRIGTKYELSLVGYTDKMQPDYKVLPALVQILIKASGREVAEIIAEIEACKGNSLPDYEPPTDTKKHGIRVDAPETQTAKPDLSILGAPDDDT